ncbi:hypothetical protein I6F26_10260 [Ensifer sp. IC3342]|nr:hypothetical protein [Ensifer sp. BRP08]MCA1446962.1 hypothetical protein [Ensifer sp. IC3342]
MTSPLLQNEFPDFDPATLPAIPAGFVDSSWHNDVCPSFLDEQRRLQVFIDYADPGEREFPESRRFRLHRLNEHLEYVDTIAGSDDWSEMLDTIEEAGR